MNKKYTLLKEDEDLSVEHPENTHRVPDIEKNEIVNSIDGAQDESGDDLALLNMPSEPLSCRICLEDGVRADFIAPCACRGTSKWVHRQCLDQWRTTREDKVCMSLTKI